MHSRAESQSDAVHRKELIEAQLARRMPHLRFDNAALEEEFERFHLLEARGGMTIALVLGTVLYGLTGIVDYTATGLLAEILITLRMGIGVPALMLALMVVRRSRSERLVQWAGCLGLAVSGGVVVAMLVLLPTDQQQFYIVGLTVMVFVPYCFVRLNVRFALLSGLLITLGYALAIPLFREIPLLHWAQACYFLLLANVVGFSACYLIEYYQRRNFLAHALLQRQQQELEQANIHLHKLSTEDPLTSVANRRHFEDFLALAWRQALRESTPLAVIMLDIDWFKYLNDHYGHQVGDDALIRFAQLASAHVRRPLDIIGRYGGEEFVIVLSDTCPDQAREIADSVRCQLKALAVPNTASPLGVMTLSAGIVCAVPSSDQQPYDFIRLADTALYEAKNRGRDCVVAVTPETGVSVGLGAPFRQQ